MILVNHCFSPGNVTLCHLACALGLVDVVNVLIKRSLNITTIWSNKDDEGGRWGVSNVDISIHTVLHV